MYRMNSHSRRSGALSLAHALGLMWALAVAFGSAATAQDISQRIDSLLANARIGGARVGVYIMDAETGHVLADVVTGKSASFIPASNMKVVTSGAALLSFGAEYSFRTELTHADGKLIITGGGDPGLADPKLLEEMNLSVDDFFDQWVLAIEQAGIEEIDELIVDDRLFDRESVHESWPKDQLNRWYCAEVSGLNFHANVLSVYAYPTNAGMAPTVRTEPETDWLNIDNTARSVSHGSNTLWVARPPGTNAMRLAGNVRWATEEAVEVTVHDSPMILARLFAEKLERAGFGRVRYRRAGDEETLPESELIAAVVTPMETALERCNQDSHNLYAECMIKLLGAKLTGQPGSWATGAAAIRMQIQELLGPRYASEIVISDGSGMSRGNRVSPALLAKWLAVMLEADDDVRDVFLATLAQPGETGTLRKRFTQRTPQNEVRAKSGYLNGVSCLSGYLGDPENGNMVAFSILVNEIPPSVPVRSVKELQEKIVMLADKWLTERQFAAVRSN